MTERGPITRAHTAEQEARRLRQAGCPEGLVDNALDLGLLLPLVDDALDVERAVRMVTGRGTPQDRRWLKRSGLSKAFKVLKGKP